MGNGLLLLLQTTQLGLLLTPLSHFLPQSRQLHGLLGLQLGKQVANLATA
jgi:hypothetical protein